MGSLILASISSDLVLEVKNGIALGAKLSVERATMEFGGGNADQAEEEAEENNEKIENTTDKYLWVI